MKYYSFFLVNSGLGIYRKMATLIQFSSENHRVFLKHLLILVCNFIDVTECLHFSISSLIAP